MRGKVRTFMPVLIAMVLGLCGMMVGCGGSAPSEDTSTPAEVTAEATVERAYTEAIAKGATVLHLTLKADQPLAENVADSSVTLDGALFGFEVSDVERVDDVTLNVVATLPEGVKAQDDRYAYVMLDDDAFAEPHDGTSEDASGDLVSIGQVIALSVGDPEATVLPLEGSYDADAHVFLLPVSLGHAEFVRTPEAADFSLADESLTIGGVDYDGSSTTEATVRIDVSAHESARDAFDALDATLTADGMTVSSDATNCGEVVVGSAQMREAERDGFATTALSCLAAKPAVFVEDTYAIESKTQDEDGETDYDVHLQTRIEASPGTCVLPENGLGEAVEVDHLTGGDEGQVLGEDVIRTDETHLCLNIYLPSKVVDALSDEEGEAALEEAQILAARIVRAHKLALADGVLSNAWGIPEPRTEIPIRLVDNLEEEAGENTDDDATFALIRKAYAEENDENDASTSNDGDDTSQPDDQDINADGKGDSTDDQGQDEAAHSSDDSQAVPSDVDPEAALEADDDESEVTIVEDDSLDGTDGVDETFGTADYTAYNLANDDEDLKKAKEAFETMSKIIETAGAFASFAAEGNPGDLIEGIGGVFGFVSQAIGFGEGELLDLQGVMDKLNKMDSEITAIDSKIDQLATQLADVEKRLGYHEDLNALRVAVTQTEVYGSTLEKDMWNQDTAKWDYDETKGFDGMTEEQKAALDKFLEDIDGIQSTFGYNAAKDTITLGNLIVGDPSLAASSVIQEYNDCIDTLFNWEPETYMYRMLYMSRLQYAYICGYTTAVTQLQYSAWKSGNPDKYVEALKALTSNYQKVQQTVQGKATYEKGKATQIEESVFVAATHARSDGNIKNLVTGQLFGADSHQLIYLGGLTEYCHKTSHANGVRKWKYDGSISRGNFESMASRLGNTKYKSLWEEMVAMTGSDRAFITSEWSARLNMKAYWEDNSRWPPVHVHAKLDADSSKPANEYYGRVLVSDTESHCLHNQASHRHTYNWTADYFDLNDNSVHTGAEIYIADQKYKPSISDSHWSMDIDLHNFYTMKAVG